MKNTILSLLFVIIMAGCSSSATFIDTANKNDSSFVVLNNADSEINLINGDGKVIKTIKNEDRFSHIVLDEKGTSIYATSDGTRNGTQPFLYQYSALDGKLISKIKLSKIPYFFTIYNNKAYISSTEQGPDGFPITVLDLTTKEETSFDVKGVVSVIKEHEGKIYIGLISGGPNLYGEYSNIYSVSEKNNTYDLKPVLNEKIELPPGDVYFDGDKLYCLYAGFTYGPKPDWVKDTDKYTNKLMVFDLKNGKLIKDLKLSKPFPQKIVKYHDNFYINHYTDLDMKGFGITVLDTKELTEERHIDLTDNYYMDLNKKNGSILVSNPLESTITLLKADGKQQKISVKGNCSIVKFIQ